MAADARVIRAGLDDIQRQLSKWREVRNARTNRHIQKDQNRARAKKRGKGAQASQTSQAPETTETILVVR